MTPRFRREPPQKYHRTDPNRGIPFDEEHETLTVVGMVISIVIALLLFGMVISIILLCN